jgi:anti-sigma B factor antagonist
MALVIEHREYTPGVVLIHLTGRLVLGPDAEKLEHVVTGYLSKGYRNFIFDVAEVTHIDSTGIGRFIYSFNKVYPLGGTLRIAGAQGSVRDGFHVTRLDTVFNFYPDVESAASGLGK